MDQLPFSKSQIIEWVSNFQIPVLPNDENSLRCCGFRGGFHIPFTPPGSDKLLANDISHLANTYCALAILKICGDDFSRVNKKEIAASLKFFQNPKTGCFQCLPCEIGKSEEDVRFLYCACCISTMLEDWSGVDKEKAIEYLLNCQDYAGGFGWATGTESHSGLTYCVVVSLKMMNAVDRIRGKEELINYMVHRCNEGWNGRIGKVADSCYSLWNTASLAALGKRVIANKYRI